MGIVKRGLVASAVAVASIVGVAMSGPLHASANAGDIGNIKFVGHAELAAYPCLAVCNGTAEFTATGTVVVGTSAYVVDAVTAAFTYSEPCVPTLGTADGTANVYGTLAGTGGDVLITTEFFHWMRVGASAAILIGDGPPPVTPLTADGAGYASFVPLAGTNNICSPLAPASGGPLSAYVAGGAYWT